MTIEQGDIGETALQKALLASFLDAAIEEKKGGASSMKPLPDPVDVTVPSTSLQVV